MKTFIYLIFICLLCKLCRAQNAQSHGVSNYSGSLSVFVNPALLVSSKLSADIAVSEAANFTNNKKESPVSFKPKLFPISAGGTSRDTAYYLTSFDLIKDQIKPGQQFDLHENIDLGFFLKIHHKTALGFNFKTDDFYLQRNDSTHNLNLKDSQLAFQSFAFQTITGTLSQIVFENKNHLISAGINLSNYFSYLRHNSGTNSSLDVGLNYEFSRKSHIHKYFMDGKNRYYDDDYKYNFKISAAIQNIDLKASDSYMKPTLLDILADFKLPNDFYLTLHSSAIINKNNYYGTEDTIMNANYIHNYLTAQLRFEAKYFEFGIPVTYQYGNSSQPVSAGIVIHIYDFIYAGSDRLTNIFEQKSPDNFYFGLRIPIMHSKRVDFDGDTISDKYDNCVHEAGLQKFKGCPDTDGDGIRDKEDSCHLDFGIAKFNGCPDSDNDNIPDKKDKCPNDSGRIVTNGCPDRDGDGVIDKDDQCIDEFGLERFFGCPDSDNDTVPDKFDNCPNEPGPKALLGCPDDDGDGFSNKEDDCRFEKGTAHGCPDRDKDGIPDKEDDCQDVAGHASARGCPDKDGDGLQDTIDKCPDQPGLLKDRGCPRDDSDRDGIPDFEDSCKNKFGLKEHKGCPPGVASNSEMTARMLDEKFKNLDFVGTDLKLSKESEDILNEVILFLKENKYYKLKISYVDSTNEPARKKISIIQKFFSDNLLDQAEYIELIDRSYLPKGSEYNGKKVYIYSLFYKIEFSPPK